MNSIKKELIVEASQKTAFKVFTEQMDEWWPKNIHVGKSPLSESVLEPWPNGRWYTKHEDGSTVNVGYVITWDPYLRLVLAWQISGNFTYDPNLITEVELNFTKEGENFTKVEFEHRNLDKLEGGAKVIADMDNGWGFILGQYQAVVLKTITNS
jgi:hypothetical protein